MTLARAYRSEHSYPLTKVTMGLRQFIDAERGELSIAPPAQRLKRLDAIIAKLARQSTRLSQMEDVAGCRAVLQPFLIGRVARRIRRNWGIVNEDDYFANPKQDGYRALHIVVQRDSRLVEIQLRTVALHFWAEVLENVAAATGVDLKHEHGPPRVREAFARLAELLAGLEAGQLPVDDASTGEIATLLERINQFMRRGHDLE